MLGRKAPGSEHLSSMAASPQSGKESLRFPYAKPGTNQHLQGPAVISEEPSSPATTSRKRKLPENHETPVAKRISHRQTERDGANAGDQVQNARSKPLRSRIKSQKKTGREGNCKEGSIIEKVVEATEELTSSQRR